MGLNHYNHELGNRDHQVTLEWDGTDQPLKVTVVKKGAPGETMHLPLDGALLKALGSSLQNLAHILPRSVDRRER